MNRSRCLPGLSFPAALLMSLAALAQSKQPIPFLKGHQLGETPASFVINSKPETAGALAKCMNDHTLACFNGRLIMIGVGNLMNFPDTLAFQCKQVDTGESWCHEDVAGFTFRHGRLAEINVAFWETWEHLEPQLEERFGKPSTLDSRHGSWFNSDLGYHVHAMKTDEPNVLFVTYETLDYFHEEQKQAAKEKQKSDLD